MKEIDAQLIASVLDSPRLMERASKYLYLDREHLIYHITDIQKTQIYLKCQYFTLYADFDGDIVFENREREPLHFEAGYFYPFDFAVDTFYIVGMQGMANRLDIYKNIILDNSVIIAELIGTGFVDVNVALTDIKNVLTNIYNNGLPCNCEGDGIGDDKMRYVDAGNKQTSDKILTDITSIPNWNDGNTHVLDLSNCFPQGVSIGKNKLLSVYFDITITANNQFDGASFSFAQSGNTQYYNFAPVDVYALALNGQELYQGAVRTTFLLYVNEAGECQFTFNSSVGVNIVELNLVVRGAFVGI